MWYYLLSERLIFSDLDRLKRSDFPVFSRFAFFSMLLGSFDGFYISLKWHVCACSYTLGTRLAPAKLLKVCMFLGLGLFVVFGFCLFFFFNCSLFLSSFQCLKTEDIKFVIEFFVCVWVVLLQESVRSLIGT